MCNQTTSAAIQAVSGYTCCTTSHYSHMNDQGGAWIKEVNEVERKITWGKKKKRTHCWSWHWLFAFRIPDRVYLRTADGVSELDDYQPILLLYSKDINGNKMPWYIAFIIQGFEKRPRKTFVWQSLIPFTIKIFFLLWNYFYRCERAFLIGFPRAEILLL